MIHNQYRQGVQCIILNNSGQILLVQLQQYSNNEWNLVGGGIEGNESLRKSLFRELEEELNLNQTDITVISKSKYKSKYNFDSIVERDGKTYVGQEKTIFVCIIKSKNIIKINTDEVRDYKWVYPEDINSYVSYPDLIEKIQKVLIECYPNVLLHIRNEYSKSYA